MTAIATLLSALTDGTVRVVDLTAPAPAEQPESFAEHAHTFLGTHITVRGSRDVAPVIGQAVLLDFAAEVTADPDFLLERDHVLEWEARHGGIPKDAWLLYRTGWGQYAEDPTAFLNADEEGAHTPGISADCARWLAQERHLSGIGVDTPGLDAGQSARLDPPHPVRELLLGEHTTGVSALRHLNLLPDTGAAVIVAPSGEVCDGTVAARVFALVEGKVQE